MLSEAFFFQQRGPKKNDKNDIFLTICKLHFSHTSTKTNNNERGDKTPYACTSAMFQKPWLNHSLTKWKAGCFW